MKITIKDQTPLCSEYKVIVVGSVGIEKVNFELDETWKDLQVFACFKNSNLKEEYSQFLSNSNEAYIPWEVLTVPGTLFIGVLGMDDERIIKPTIGKEVAKIREGTSADGIASEEHSATALEQVVALAQSVRDEADAGKFDGVGIEQIEINTLGELVITYTDGTIDNLGVITTGGGSSIAPQIRINPETNEWEISTDGGETYVSTGVKAIGKDGVSATHSWDGTVLTITSASGTSSADLKGEQGIQGEQGISITGAEINSDGELVLIFSNNQRTNVGNVIGAKGDKGDQGLQGVSGVYVGTGDMPEGYNIQIDPTGDADLFIGEGVNF